LPLSGSLSPSSLALLWPFPLVVPSGRPCTCSLACAASSDHLEEIMMMRGQARLLRIRGANFGLVAAMLLAGWAGVATALEPSRIGFSMALAGPLAANGKQALLGLRIWEEQMNAKGGLLGRPVKLVYYDDQTSPSTVPGIYTKLIDVDKVDLVLGPYATNM